MAVDHRPVHALRLAALELLLESSLRRRVLGEDHETRSIAVDAMDDERASLAARPEVILEPAVDRLRGALALERHREQPGRLVDHEQQFVFEQDGQVAAAWAGAAAAFALPGRSIHTRTLSPAFSVVPASRTLASRPFRNTLPRSSTTTARARDPMRPGAARNLSSLTPASGASTVQSVSDIFRHGSASRYNLRVRQP